ncbi:MAG: RNA pseudouridine synthase, partial [Thermoflexaceae bacterium]|nr:RNA pseudouridine synthase [Thermoflexaceae bacterium]
MEQIIYEDKNIIVFHKPAGMLVQSDRSFDVDVVSSLMTYLAEKGEKPEIFVINRLDRPVSGLVLLAKNKKFAAALSQELQNGAINKEYYAVVCGSMPQKKGMLTDYLLKDARNNISEVVDSKIKGAKEAKLEYEVISSKNIPWNGGMQEVSLVKIHLITGRHHQIRVQFASRGVPLLGDA